MKIELPKTGPWEFVVSSEPLLNPKTGEPTGRNAIYHGDRMIHICGKNFAIRQNKDAHEVVKAIYERRPFVDNTIGSDRDGSYHAILWGKDTLMFAGEVLNFGVGVVNTHNGTSPFSFYPIAAFGKPDGVVFPIGRPMAFYKSKDSEKLVADAITRIESNYAAWILQLSAFVNDTNSRTMELADAVIHIQNLLTAGADSELAESHRHNRIMEIIRKLVMRADGGTTIRVSDYILWSFGYIQSKILRREVGTVYRAYELAAGKHRLAMTRHLKGLAKMQDRYTAEERASALNIIKDIIKERNRESP